MSLEDAASFQAYDHKLRFNMSYDQIVLKYRHSVTNVLACVMAQRTGYSYVLLLVYHFAKAIFQWLWICGFLLCFSCTYYLLKHPGMPQELLGTS